MDASINMSKAKIPILPVTHRVIYPGTALRITLSNLPEFARGKKLTMFGIVTYKNASTKELYDYGTLVGVVSEMPVTSGNNYSANDAIISSFFNTPLSSFPRNEWQITVMGVERFKIKSLRNEGGVYMAKIEVVKDKDSDQNIEELTDKLKKAGAEYASKTGFSRMMTQQRVHRIQEEKDLAYLGFYIAGFLDLSIPEKQMLLENFSLIDRSKKILEHCKVSEDSNEEALSKEVSQKIQEKFYQKSSRNRNPKFMNSGDEEEVQKLQEKIEALEMPDSSKKYVLNELNRVKSMRPINAEYNVIMNYLETVSSLPWNLSSQDNLDLEKAQTQLDIDHSGLEKVKKRIIEYLAVRGLKGDMKGSIICFVGPPGVGKTSLGQSIADSLGRKFHRISLGGVRDEAEIRGHRKTYVGAMPGVFIQGLKKCGTNNPVILLDEIDKVGKDMIRGDTASALLEVLDPSQNHTFTDHYLAVPFDLSNVLFIATANTVSSIPSPLLDRMDTIHLSGYSTYEKLSIAKNFLLPRQINENGLKPEHISVPDEVLNKVITEYTLEAGVRQLERTLGSLCRHVAVKYSKSLKANSEFKTEVIDEPKVDEVLGAPKYDLEIQERVQTPGVALGLAWTPYGGKVMLVETSKSPGTGKLRITGQLGDVMKESVLTALSWIQAHFPALCPNASSSSAEGLEGIDLHIHFPAAAVPKDGPSAGVTITTALVGLLGDVKTRSDTCMTGEISLKGNVMPVGGIKEKVLGAHRTGIKRVLLPFRNQKDTRDIPEYVKKEVQFVFVKKVEEVLREALEESNIFRKMEQIPHL